MIPSSLKIILSGLFFYSALYWLSRVKLAQYICTYLLGPTVQFVRVDKSCSEGNEVSNNKVKTVSDGELAEIAQLLVGVVFAVLASVFGLLIMYQAKDDVISQQSWVLVPFAHFGAWYYVVDLFTMFTSYQARRQISGVSAVARFIRGRWSVVGHHVLLLCVGYPLAVNPSIRRGKGDFVLGALIVQDLSTPFLSVVKILRLLGLNKSFLYRMTGLSLLSTFLVARVANLPLVTLLYSAQHHDWDVPSALATMTPICHLFNSIVFLMQLYWFLSLLRIAVASHWKRDTVKTN